MLDSANRFWPHLGAALCAAICLAGCGQRGPLYMPDKNARVVTRPATASAPDASSSAPTDSSSPAAAPR
jgi:predicted small lipoprotein YifL